MNKIRCAFITGIMLLGMRVANAQINPSTFLSPSTQGATSTNFYFARPNDLTILVDVVGFVQRPGRYEIASSIDLVNLMSLAGGPTPDGDLSTVTIIRIMEKDASTTRKKIQIDLEDLSTVKQEELRLAPGDLVLVNKTNWSSFRDNFGVIGSIATLGLAITQYILVQQR